MPPGHRGGPLASPSLVWDVAIGQSTMVTQHVKANLFYRGLAFHRAPQLGDTLRTSTRVVALRQNRPRRAERRPGWRCCGSPPWTSSGGRCWTSGAARCCRCAIRPSETGHADELEAVGISAGRAGRPAAALVGAWRLDRFARQAGGPRFGELRTGQSWPVAGGDVVSGAPELARLTLNVAMVHHDAAGLQQQAPGLRRAHHRAGARPGGPFAARPSSPSRPGTAATTSARCTRGTHCTARSRSSRPTTCPAVAAWCTCVLGAGRRARRPGRCGAARCPRLAVRGRRRLIPGQPRSAFLLQSRYDSGSG